MVMIRRGQVGQLKVGTHLF